MNSSPSSCLIAEKDDIRVPGFNLESIKRTIWLTRADLRNMTNGDQAKFDWWLTISGTREYRALSELGMSIPRELMVEPAPVAFPEVWPPLTKYHHLLWSMRADLQEAFNLNHLEGQQDFVWWYVVQGRLEVEVPDAIISEQIDTLNQPIPEVHEGGFTPVTKLMYAVWARRPDLQQVFDLQTPGGRDGFLSWYFTRGLIEFNLADFVNAEQVKALTEEAELGTETPRILWMIWHMDTALQQEYESPHDPGLADWAAKIEGSTTYPILALLTEPTQNHKTPKNIRAPITRQKFEFGVNLIGYARGQFGIGEDVRMAATALKTTSIPFCIYNVEAGTEASQKDLSAEAYLNNQLPYSINIFCTTGMETARLAAVEGNHLFKNHINIGYWPWELPDWPELWAHAYEFVDEIWASTSFLYDCYKKTSPASVRKIGIAVDVKKSNGLTRKDFSLPTNRFLFLYVFDYLSSLARKNPAALVSAFKRAFPLGTESVGLVVKIINEPTVDDEWQDLKFEMTTDNRITIISDTLPKASLLDLFRSTDCFVSLHRSEGFGRCIAEAMLLEKPVIVTGYSGNMDFTNNKNAGIVEYTHAVVEKNQYPYAEGLIWADPSIDHASWWMRRFFNQHDLGKNTAENGRQSVECKYNVCQIGKQYSQYLMNLSK